MKPAPVTVNCNVTPTDTLSVEAADTDVVLFAKDAMHDETVSLYLNPAEARRLRKALKRAIKHVERRS